MKLFRDLSQAEEEKFREWARQNYNPFTEIRGVWHPVIQRECTKINEETEVQFPKGREGDKDA